jgi:hypothetical protein
MLEEFLSKEKIYHIKLPNGQKRAISIEEINEISLNPEHVLPEINGQKTWVSNYVATFWMRFMKPQGFALYLQLQKMAYGEKDFSFPSVPYLAMLTGMSDRSVQKYLMHLYDLGFLVIIESQDARTYAHDSNIYLLTSVTPFLSTKQYEALPKRLQSDHDKFMEHLKRKKLLQGSPDY